MIQFFEHVLEEIDIYLMFNLNIKTASIPTYIN